MGRSVAALLILLSLLLPMASIEVGQTDPTSIPVRVEADLPVLDGLTFPEALDTNGSVREYTMVSRALLLPGGSSDVELADLNGDGLSDLIVAVYEAKMISIFYGQSNGIFLSYPSFNLTTVSSPFQIAPVSVNGTGDVEIVSLERNAATSGTKIVVYELTSETTYNTWDYTQTYSNAVGFVVGNFSADSYPDIAIACAGPDPNSSQGIMEVYFGPDFNAWSSYVVVLVGTGPTAIVADDLLDDDGQEEIAVSNYFNSSVMVFRRPFTWGTVPVMTLSVEGFPVSLTSGRLDGDALSDLAVVTEGQVAVRLFMNSLGVLPVQESYNRSLNYTPSAVLSYDMSGDGKEDLLLLSADDEVMFGFYQPSSGLICEKGPDFAIPTAADPRSAVVGNLDSDGSPDIALASARGDWSGSHLSVYPSRSGGFSNANATAWIDRSLVPWMLASGDLDGDDVVDLVVLDTNATSFEYLLSFKGETHSVPLEYIPSAVLVEDFNHDGSAEVVTSESGGSRLTLTLDAASPSATNIILASSGNVMDLTTGDFNSDEWTDLLVATDNGSLDIFFNLQQTVPFGSRYQFSPTPGAGIWSIAVGDFNSDGMEDIAYTRSIRKIAILYQNPAIPFGPDSPTDVLSHTEGSDFTAIWGADVTRDGKTDIAAMRSGDPSIYLFDQTMFTSAPHPYATLALPDYPKYVSIMDFTDDGPADVVAIFEGVDLVFLYRQNETGLPASPSMVFVTGADPNFATIGDATGDHRGDLLVCNAASHAVSAWQQINFPPLAHAGGPYYTMEGDPLRILGSATTGTSEIPYMEYYWRFGDGNESGWVRQPRPTYTYILTGNFTLSVDVRDPIGLTSSDQTYVIVEDASPHVAFEWSPLQVGEGQTVTFSDLTYSFDPVAYRNWTVDGAYVGSGSTLITEFQNGTHNISLEVIDVDGSDVSVTQTLSVLSRPPDLRIDGPTVAVEGEDVVFRVYVDEWHGSPVDPIASYEWDFSYVSGSFVPDPYAPESSSASHVFSTTSYSKIFRIASRVTDVDGNQSIATWDIQIFDTGPVSHFVLSVSNPEEGVPFYFSSNSSSFDGIVNWTWILEYPNGTSQEFYDDAVAMGERAFSFLDNGSYSMQLRVKEADGNTSVFTEPFEVQEIAPFVTLTTQSIPDWPGYYQEFSAVNFTAVANSLDEVVSFEWDFMAAGGEFIPDAVTSSGEIAYSYSQAGNFTVKLRVTDSDSSKRIASIYIEIRHKPLVGGFYDGIGVQKGIDNSYLIFNASLLSMEFPDIIQAHWEFGDGSVLDADGISSEALVHRYIVGADYQVVLTLTDDDGYMLTTATMVYITPPTIVLVQPSSGSVVRSGTEIIFSIIPGSTPVTSVFYMIDHNGYELFGTQYTINTTDWEDGLYVIAVRAWDTSGNVAGIYNFTFIIDDTSPLATVSVPSKDVFGGDILNVTVRVGDPNVQSSGIHLYVRYQGETAFSVLGASGGLNGQFYCTFEIPLREGMIGFYVNVTDMAGNSVQTELYSLDVKLHFIDEAWPYLLAIAVLAMIGTFGYFARESRIAVDETFVIYSDGRLISHSTRRLKPGMDDQILGSMFIAIQDFVKDSFKDATSFTLRRLDFGDKSIVIEKGSHVLLAVVLHGQASRKVALKMQRVVTEIETRFGDVLSGWDGDLDKVRGVNDIVKKLYSRAPVLPGSLRRN